MDKEVKHHQQLLDVQNHQLIEIKLKLEKPMQEEVERVQANVLKLKTEAAQLQVETNDNEVCTRFFCC